MKTAGQLLRTALLILVVAPIQFGCTYDDRAPARFVRQIDWAENGLWLKADTQVYSNFSTGDDSVDEVLAKASKNGCNVIAITDRAEPDARAATPQQADAIASARKVHRDIMILVGLDWAVARPDGIDRFTILVPTGADEFKILSEFKERFATPPDPAQDGDRGAEALAWLDEAGTTNGVRPVVIYNHPSRTARASMDIADRFARWRKGSDLLVGLAGAPGHQGGIDLGDYQPYLQTIERWDPAVARTGDAWDTLLSSGLDVWGAYAPSEFSSEKPRRFWDYRPGQFSETWLYAPEASADGVLRALRAGSFFADHGHIVRNVQLSVEAAGLPRPAYAGEVIEVPVSADVLVRMDGVVPERDWLVKPNWIDSVELIAVTQDGSRVIARRPQFAQQLYLDRMIQVPPGGMVLRARGRRVVPDGPDLMFYTNPIRILVPDSTNAEPTHYAFPIKAPRSTIEIVRWGGGVLLILLVMVCLLATRLPDRAARTSPASHMRSGRQLAYRVRTWCGRVATWPFSLVSWRILGRKQFQSRAKSPSPAAAEAGPARSRPWTIAAILYVAVLCVVFFRSTIENSAAPGGTGGDISTPAASDVASESAIEPQTVWLLIGKAALFAPLGMLLAKMILAYSLPVTSRRILLAIAILLCCGFGVFIELAQQTLPNDIFRPDDILADTVGASLGIAVIVSVFRR